MSEILGSKERVPWSYYDRYDDFDKKYFVPTCNDFRTKADQAYQCVCRLVYKWYNDGDVYDNTYHLEGWFNDISSFANWLYNYVDGTKDTLALISSIWSDEEYEQLLKRLFEIVIPKLADLEKDPVVGNVLECSGPFECRNEEPEDEEYW